MAKRTVEMKCVSKHTKQRVGITYANSTSANRTLKEGGQYVFVYGKGSKRVSETRHMTASQADAYKAQLEG